MTKNEIMEIAFIMDELQIKENITIREYSYSNKILMILGSNGVTYRIKIGGNDI